MAERFGRPPADSQPPAPRHADAEEDEPAPLPTPAPAPARPAPARSPQAQAAGGVAGTERLDLQVQKHQEELLQLRRQQEQIERQKRELEELSRRQEELEQGRNDLIEKLTRALVIVERQSAEAQQRVELLHATSDSFGSHLRSLEGINAKSWASADIQRELSRALGMVDHARTEYNQQKGRLVTESEGDGDGGEALSGGDRYDQLFGGGDTDRNFLYFLKAGFAFTLPLVLVLLLVAFLLCWKLVNGSV